ncbi:MAG TPA: hypothetical protein VKA27_00480, partial [Sunxiuqinia sp.]|nr:hypothetical protein [Sunxiuqinia sp.]
MKRITILCFLVFFILGKAYSAQPVRDPFVELFVDGKKLVNAAEINVQKGDRFTVLAQIKGGLKDVVHFPDTYLDLGPDDEIVSKGYNKLVYKKDGKLCSWAKTDEKVNFESDNRIKLDINNDLVNKHQAEVIIPVAKVEKSYIKVTITTTWEYTEDSTTKQETNEATAVVYLDIQGNNNEWFATPNVKANGAPDEGIKQTLNEIQGSYNTIEDLFANFNFAAIQPEIHKLQASVNKLDQQLHMIAIQNPSHHSEIYFVGLPSDRAVSEISDFRAIAAAWDNLQQLVDQETTKLHQLEHSGDNIKKRDLLNIIKPFLEWQENLPSDAESLLHQYAKEIKWQDIRINTYLSFNPEEERINNKLQVEDDLHRFLDNRSANMAFEKQKISYALTRIQAVRIFDGMLRGFFSSINFA